MKKEELAQQRYEMFKKVLQENRLRRHTIDSIWFQYMEQLNKAVYAAEIDDVLDAIIENEKRLGKKV